MNMHRILAMTTLLLAAGLTGCAMEERVVSTSFGFQPSSQRDDSRGRSGLSSSDAHEESGSWAIALGRVAGDNHRQRAQDLAEQIGDYVGTSDVWVGADGNGTMIYYGRYDSRSDPVARADLARWREYHRKGELRLPLLLLSPIVDREGGEGDDEISQWALQNVASEGDYTFQVGLYDEDYGDDFRDAAEEAVRVLRDDGWEAYYWHGPVGSTVSIGVFTEEARDPNNATPEAQQLMVLKQHFPHNSLNGRTVRVRQNGQSYDQPSFLVRMPR